MKHAHSQHGGTLGDVGQGDHGPQVGAAVQVHQLGVDGVGHVVQSGHHNGGVQQAEEGRKQPAHIGGEAGIHHRGDGVADLPSDGTHDGVGHQDRRHQGAEGHHDHAHHFGADLFKELLQVHQHKAGQHGGDDLALISDHLDLDKAEVPHGDVLHGGGGHREAVEQLGGHQGQAQDDAQDLGGAHLLGDGPHDAHGQHVEHRLADEPQEAVHAGPKLGHIRQALGPAAQEVDLTDDVAEAQDQAAADEGGDDGGEDLAQSAHDPLEQRLVRLGSRLHRILADPLNARAGGELIVEDGHIVADDDLKLSGLGKGPLYRRDGLDSRRVRLGRVRQHKPHPGHAVGHRLNIFPASNGPQKRLYICLILCHGRLPSCWF